MTPLTLSAFIWFSVMLVTREVAARAMNPVKNRNVNYSAMNDRASSFNGNCIERGFRLNHV